MVTFRNNQLKTIEEQLREFEEGKNVETISEASKAKQQNNLRDLEEELSRLRLENDQLKSELEKHISSCVDNSKEKYIKDLGGDKLEGKISDNTEVILWIFNNLRFKDVDIKDAPTSGAYFYLKEIQDDHDVKKEFLRNVWSKLIPSRREVDDRVTKEQDDGNEQITRMEQLMEASMASIEEGKSVLSSNT